MTSGTTGLHQRHLWAACDLGRLMSLSLRFHPCFVDARPCSQGTRMTPCACQVEAAACLGGTSPEGLGR